MKVCSKCGIVKPKADFYCDRARAEGIRHECKECTKAKWAAYQEANREREAARSRYNYARKTGQPVDEATRIDFDGTLRKRKALWRFARKHALRIDLGKHCTKCGEWKPRLQFTKGRQTKDGRRSACATCSAKEAVARSAVPVTAASIAHGLIQSRQARLRPAMEV